MLNSAFLFCWENTYTLNKELEKRKIWFQEKYWADTLFEFTSQNWDLWEIKQLLYAGSLFVSKKMVVLYWVPRDTYENNSLMADKIDKFLEDFQQNMSLLTSDTILILVSYKPDKRTKAFKWFSEQLQLKEFVPYKESQLKGFIREQLAGFQIGEPEVDMLLLKVWNDMYRLENEIEKVKIWLQTRWEAQVSIDAIHQYCFWLVEWDAFEIFDHLWSDPRLAVKSLEKMQEDGKTWNEVSGLLTWGLKIYLTILDLYGQGIVSAKEIIAQTKLHPFVVNKNLKYIAQLQKNQGFLVSFFQLLIDLEYAIKTGKMAEQYFWLRTKQEILKIWA